MPTKLTLSGTVNYEADIDNFVAAKVIAMIEQDSPISVDPSGARRPQTDLIGNSAGSAAQRFAGRSLIEAFNETGAKIKPFQLVVAGYRSMEEKNEDNFTSKQIIEQFRSAGISPRNLDREIKKAVSSGLIYVETGKKGSYKVTEQALKAFDVGFSQIGPIKKAAARSKKTGSNAKLEISSAVKELPIQVTMEGYPSYHDLKIKSERIIWILIFSAQNGVLSLNSKEIEHLSREVRDQIPTSSVPALTTGSIKKGYIARSGNEYRLLHEGDLLIKGK